MENFDHIEAFLSNALSEEDRLSFEAQLKSDHDLQKEVDLMRTMLMGIETKALKDKMTEVILQSRREDANVVSLSERANGNIRTTWWRVAAAILLLVTTGLWFVNRTTENEELFAVWYEADPGLPTPMSATNNYDFFDAMVDYKSEEFQKAYEKWSVLQAKNPGNDTLAYFLGSAALGQGDLPGALAQFDKVLEEEESAFYAQAQWYWSLIHFKLGDKAILKQQWDRWDRSDALSKRFPIDDLWRRLDK